MTIVLAVLSALLLIALTGAHLTAQDERNLKYEHADTIDELLDITKEQTERFEATFESLSAAQIENRDLTIQVSMLQTALMHALQDRPDDAWAILGDFYDTERHTP